VTVTVPEADADALPAVFKPNKLLKNPLPLAAALAIAIKDRNAIFVLYNKIVNIPSTKFQ
jgi:hypothetical protein